MTAVGYIYLKLNIQVNCNRMTAVEFDPMPFGTVGAASQRFRPLGQMSTH